MQYNLNRPPGRFFIVLVGAVGDSRVLLRNPPHLRSLRSLGFTAKTRHWCVPQRSFREVERALRLLTNPTEKVALSLVDIADVPPEGVGEQMLKSRRWGYYKHDEAQAVLDAKLEAFQVLG
jgi:hypothetical protein